MIDFKRRKEMFDFYDVPMGKEDVETKPTVGLDGVRDRYVEMMNNPHKPDEVLIEDEFGRLRWVKQGSVDHMNNIGSSYRIRKQVQGQLSTEASKAPTSSRILFPERRIEASRVKMTWENQLRGTEKEYFVEIDVRFLCNVHP